MLQSMVTFNISVSGTSPSTDTPIAEYAKVMYHNNGHRVLIIQAGAYSCYLGNISASFDNQCEATTWQGNPILLNQSISQYIRSNFSLTW